MRILTTIQRGLMTVAILAVATATSQAEIKTQEISYEHDGQALKGFLAWDDAVNGPRPGILVVHEWWGLNDYARKRTRQLAEMGYVAFALDMYGVGKVTNEPVQAKEWSGTTRSNTQKWRDRALAGLNVLKQQPNVDPNQLAAIGYCFGGSTVVQLAYAGAPVKGVVSFHGALTPPAAGKPVRPQVLICTGAADSSIPAAQLEAFATGMEAIQARYEIIVFGGARHSFTNPHAGEYGIENIAYNAAADRRSWANMKLFFDELFKAGQ